VNSTSLFDHTICYFTSMSQDQHTLAHHAISTISLYLSEIS